jgi:hypothetical protein
VTGSGDECVHQAADYPWASPAFDYLDLGWASYNGDSGARSMWIDDVALGGTRVGCPA